MAPIVKYSREKIIKVALNIVKEKGIEFISARNIAKELGSSICPVFSYFSNMEILKQEVMKEIAKVYYFYIDDGLRNNEKPFKGAGLAYIKFARENKNYFKAYFMGNANMKIDELLSLDFNSDKLLDLICTSTGLSKDKAIKLQKYNWVFVHGLAVMLATDYCSLEEEEISDMLTVEYTSLLARLREE